MQLFKLSVNNYDLYNMNGLRTCSNSVLLVPMLEMTKNESLILNLICFKKISRSHFKLILKTFVEVRNVAKAYLIGNL